MKSRKKSKGKYKYSAKSKLVNKHALLDDLNASIAFIYQSEMDYISRCILDYPNMETGGQLFGYLSEKGEAVVCYAIGPGHRSNHQVSFFNQDTEFLEEVYRRLHHDFALQYIGEWHSHHKLGLTQPSEHDASTVRRSMAHQGLRHFLLCIGNVRADKTILNAYSFFYGEEKYCNIPWKIVGTESPFRKNVDLALSDINPVPISQYPFHGNNWICGETREETPSVVPNYGENHWLNTKENNILLKKMIDYLTSYGKVNVSLGTDKNVFLRIENQIVRVKIVLDKSFPRVPPRLECVPYQTIILPKWEAGDGTFDNFRRYYECVYQQIKK